MFKNKIKYYFFIEVLKSFFFILTVFSILLWITQAAKSISLVTESGVSITTYAKYIFYIFPRSVSQLLLFSFSISLFLNIIKFQNSKEIEIYWLSGISKKEIIIIILNFSFLITLLSYIFFAFLTPASNAKARLVLSQSEFSIINSLVLKNNFNSPLKDLTIFVRENDNRGNLQNIYIFENQKTIIAKRGRVLNIDEKNYLELKDGTIHEKNLNNKNITIISFNKTLYDFTDFQTSLTRDLKTQEKTNLVILNEYLITKNKDILYEIHKRIFKPLFIPIIALLCCFILYGNDEKINLIKIKFTVFSFITLFIIFIEILLNLSTHNYFFKYLLYALPILGGYFTFISLNKFLISETK